MFAVVAAVIATGFGVRSPLHYGLPMERNSLILQRASTSRPSGDWNEDDFDVLADGDIVGRIFKVNAAPIGLPPWMWGIAFWHHEGRTPTHGCAATREEAMKAFAKSWRRE
jgi:hypothetical protein